jgi:Dockerin type I domain
MKINSKYILLAIIVFILICNLQAKAEWTYHGLGDTQVNVIKSDGDNLYIGTESGVHKKSINPEDTLWTSLGLADKQILSLLLFNADTIFTSADVTGMDDDTISIYRTINGGSDWQPYQNGFGGQHGYDRVIAMDRKPDGDTIFASGIACIARSLDCGTSWELVWGGWDGMAMGVVFVKVDPYNPNIVWAGGENGFFWPWLFKSEDYGATWDLWVIDVGGDNRCHDIAIDPDDSDIAIIPMEGKVIKTINGGDSWDIIHSNNYYLYSMEMLSQNNDILYMSTAQHGYPLNLLRSTNGGYDWDSIIKDSLVSNSTLDILLIESSLRADLYLATSKGVYQYTDVFSFICGDANFDATVNVSDAVWIINYVFVGGDPPIPYEAGECNCDGSVNVSDAVWIINYVFVGGNEPCDCR